MFKRDGHSKISPLRAEMNYFDNDGAKSRISDENAGQIVNI